MEVVPEEDSGSPGVASEAVVRCLISGPHSPCTLNLPASSQTVGLVSVAIALSSLYNCFIQNSIFVLKADLKAHVVRLCS